MNKISTKTNNKIIKEIRNILITTLENYTGKELIKLPYDSYFIKEILFNKDKDNNYIFINELENVYRKIDFSNIPFNNVIVINKDLSKYHNIFINPKTIGKKSLYGTVVENVTFIDNFDDVDIRFTNFRKSHNANVNQQRIKYKSLYGTVAEDVTFERGFNHVDIRYTDFTGSKNAVINPEKVKLQSLEGTICDSVFFNGAFIKINCKKTDFNNSRGALIYKNLILYDENTNFTSTTLYKDNKILQRSLPCKKEN